MSYRLLALLAATFDAAINNLAPFGEERGIESTLNYARSLLDVAPSVDLTPNFNELTAFVRFGKLASVKRYRQRTGLALRESKIAIERAIDTLGLIPGESYDSGEHFVLDPVG